MDFYEEEEEEVEDIPVQTMSRIDQLKQYFKVGSKEKEDPTLTKLAWICLNCHWQNGENTPRCYMCKGKANKIG